MEHDIHPLLTDIIHRLEKAKLLYYVNKIYLFGSRARGDANNRSDIDLAIECIENPRVWVEIYETIQATETLLKIDLINLAEASSELKQKILCEGKIIYEQHQNKTEF